MGTVFFKAQAIFEKPEGNEESGRVFSPEVHVGKNYIFVSNNKENSHWIRDDEGATGEFIITTNGLPGMSGEPKDFVAQLIFYPNGRGEVECVIPVIYSEQPEGFQVLPTINKVRHSNQPRIYKIFDKVYVIQVWADGRTLVSSITPHLKPEEIQRKQKSFVVKIRRDTVYYSKKPPVYDDRLLKSDMGTAAFLAPFVKIAHEGIDYEDHDQKKSGRHHQLEDTVRRVMNDGKRRRRSKNKGGESALS